MAGPVPDFGALLKGGKGTRKDPSLIDQRESWERRAESKQNYTDLFWGIPSIHAAGFAASVSTIDRLALAYVDPPKTGIRASQVRVRITTNVAAGVLRLALYYLQLTDQKQTPPKFVRIGPAISFDGSTTGTKTFTFSQELVVGPQPIFLGFSANDTVTLRFAGTNTVAGSVARPVSLFSTDAFGAALPPAEIAMSAIDSTIGGSQPIPLVTYLSSTFANLRP